LLIYGIDPGITGGIARINHDGKLLDGIRMPTTNIWGGAKQKKKIVDAMAVKDFIQCQTSADTNYRQHRTYVAIERVHSMPTDARSAAFSFGRSFGAVEAIACCQVGAGAVTWITPQVWKKFYNLSRVKGESIALAQTHFRRDYRWKYKADEGIAEAALIALYYLTTNTFSA
jgi:hypothetical protein|tara:strand:- start:22203 stop:22718 length:516 start_codon:yes stop_codon:yes gene_type:complete